MPVPVFSWYETDDTTPAAAGTFSPANGTPTAARTLHFWNDKGGTAGSEDATELKLFALTRTSGSGDYSLDDELALNGWVEMRVTGSGGTGITNQVSGWTPVGKDKVLPVYDIPSNCYRTVEIRLNIPAGPGTLAKDVLQRATAANPAVPISTGFSEAGLDGVRTGIGDSTFSCILYGGAITPNGTPDNKADVATLAWIHKGIPLVKLLHELTFSNLDGAAAALIATKSYVATLSLGSTTTITVTKTAQGVYPIPAVDYAAVPDGELLLGYVEVDFDATIGAGDIDQTDLLYGRYFGVVAGLDLTIHPGSGLAGNRAIEHHKANTASLTDDDTTYVWLNADGTFTAELTGAAPHPRSVLIWEAVAASGVVTALKDRRPWIGPRALTLQLAKGGTLAGGEYTPVVCLPAASRAFLRPVGGVLASLGDDGGTSGATLLDVEYSAAGGAWTSIYTSSGTTDLRPSIPYNSTDPTDSDSQPEVLAFSDFTRFRGKVVSIPGTAPVDLFLALTFELP